MHESQENVCDQRMWANVIIKVGLAQAHPNKYSMYEYLMSWPTVIARRQVENPQAREKVTPRNQEE